MHHYLHVTIEVDEKGDSEKRWTWVAERVINYSSYQNQKSAQEPVDFVMRRAQD